MCRCPSSFHTVFPVTCCRHPTTIPQHGATWQLPLAVPTPVTVCHHGNPVPHTPAPHRCTGDHMTFSAPVTDPCILRCHLSRDTRPAHQVPSSASRHGTATAPPQSHHRSAIIHHRATICVPSSRPLVGHPLTIPSGHPSAIICRCYCCCCTPALQHPTPIQCQRLAQHRSAAIQLRMPSHHRPLYLHMPSAIIGVIPVPAQCAIRPVLPERTHSSPQKNAWRGGDTYRQHTANSRRSSTLQVRVRNGAPGTRRRGHAAATPRPLVVAPPERVLSAGQEKTTAATAPVTRLSRLTMMVTPLPHPLLTPSTPHHPRSSRIFLPTRAHSHTRSQCAAAAAAAAARWGCDARIVGRRRRV